MMLRAIVSKNGLVERRFDDFGRFNLDELDIESLIILERGENYILTNRWDAGDVPLDVEKRKSALLA